MKKIAGFIVEKRIIIMAVILLIAGLCGILPSLPLCEKNFLSQAKKYRKKA